VSDDLSNEQLMSCRNAERILAKRAETQEASAAAASDSLKKSATSLKDSVASLPKLTSAPRDEDSSLVSPDTSYEQDTPRSSRLLLFVLVKRFRVVAATVASDIFLRRVFCCQNWKRFRASLCCREPQHFHGRRGWPENKGNAAVAEKYGKVFIN
jgi:hypothetical protein